jgi:hypothetical protein
MTLIVLVVAALAIAALAWLLLATRADAHHHPELTEADAVDNVRPLSHAVHIIDDDDAA